MGLTARQNRTLTSIEHRLRAREPRLASMFSMFARLTQGEALPGIETISVKRWHWLTELAGPWRSRRRHRRRLRQRRRAACPGPVRRILSAVCVPIIVLGLMSVILVIGVLAPLTGRCVSPGYRYVASMTGPTSRECPTWRWQTAREHP